MSEEAGIKVHRWCAIHRVCLDCGARGRDVLTGKRACECPGGADTTIAAISHIIAERRFQQGQAAYSKGWPGT